MASEIADIISNGAFVHEPPERLLSLRTTFIAQNCLMMSVFGTRLRPRLIVTRPHCAPRANKKPRRPERRGGGTLAPAHLRTKLRLIAVLCRISAIIFASCRIGMGYCGPAPSTRHENAISEGSGQHNRPYHFHESQQANALDRLYPYL